MQKKLRDLCALRVSIHEEALLKRKRERHSLSFGGKACQELKGNALELNRTPSVPTVL